MTYEDRQDRKLAHFVDRVPHLRRLEDEVLGLDGGPAQLLVFWGVGGQGKSLLLQRFERNLVEDPQYRHIRHARIDFNERREREPWRPLIWIRNALAAQGVRFTRFDLAFALYWSQFPERGRDLPMLTGRWFRLTGESAGAALADVGSTATELSVAAVTEGISASVPFLGRALAFLGRATYDLVERRRLIAANESLAALFSGEHRDALLPPSQIAARLPALLAEDLDAHRQDHPGCRIVLLIDETERVLEQGGAPERRTVSEVEDSLHALARRLRGGLMVFAGREPLRWEQDLDLGPRLVGRQAKLGGLPVNDARTLLAKEGVTDPALVDALIAAASAPESDDDPDPVYPLLIDLQLQHLANLTARGEDVDPALLRVDAEGFEDKRNILLDRLLRDYGAPLQGALRHLALCSWIDREVFRCLVRDLGLGVQRDAWRTISTLSFMRRRTDAGVEAVVIHGAVADALALELDPRDRAETHAVLARHFETRVCQDPTDLRAPLNLVALEAAVTHRIAASISPLGRQE